MTIICVTGASGFIGTELCGKLYSAGFLVRGVVRSMQSSFSVAGITPVAVGNLDSTTNWSPALAGVDCVIHCAGRAHVMFETSGDALAGYRSVNVQATRRLAEQAAAAGVRRLVFLSSIGVNGVLTGRLPRGVKGPRNDGTPFSPHDLANPVEDYAISKWEAEQALWEISAKTGLEVVVVRPPLVYGPGGKGNVARLLKLVRIGVPLPFAAVHNKRSFIGLDNLGDLLIRCVDHQAAAGQTFLVSDGEDLSTPVFIRHIAAAMGRSVQLFPVPVSLLRLAGRVLGKRAEIDRLVGSLQIDSSHTRQVLDWTPPVSVEEGIRRMVQSA